MAEAVLETIAGSLGGARSLLVALSGGRDSVVLLHALLSLQGPLGLRVEAAHFEHGIRGEESLGDLRFVQELCENWEVPLHVGSASVPETALETGENLEQAARRLRYAYLEETREKRGLDRIVTAHHMDDQAETLLLHLIRGSGLRGLCGIKRDNGKLLRPMLSLSREQIEEYRVQHSLPFREDSSNGDEKYRRNFLRARVLPELNRANPAAARNIALCADRLREDEDFLQALTAEVYEQGRNGKKLRLDPETPGPLRKRALYRFLEDSGEKDIDGEKLAALDRLLRAPNGARADIGGRLFEKGEEGICPVEDAPDFLVEIVGSGDYRLPDGACLEVRVGAPAGDSRCQADIAVFGSGLDFPIIARRRRDGDRMRPFGMEGSRLLSDILTDKKVGRAQRDRLPVLEKAGEILAVLPVRRSALCPVSGKEQKVIRIRYIPHDDLGKKAHQNNT